MILPKIHHHVRTTYAYRYVVVDGKPKTFRTKCSIYSQRRTFAYVKSAQRNAVNPLTRVKLFEYVTGTKGLQTKSRTCRPGHPKSENDDLICKIKVSKQSTGRQLFAIDFHASWRRTTSVGINWRIRSLQRSGLWTGIVTPFATVQARIPLVNISFGFPRFSFCWHATPFGAIYA